MESKNRINVLYVDDESHNLYVFKANFRLDYNVFIAPSASEGLKILHDQEIHVIITDQRMPETTGVEFLASIIPQFPDPVRILLTGYSDIGAVIEAVNKGQIFHYLSKPWDDENLREVIEKAYELYTARKQEQEKVDQLLKTNEQLEFHLRQSLLS
jgi:response regulator RpfG family c-di-GMP phosphodiesterase